METNNKFSAILVNPSAKASADEHYDLDWNEPLENVLGGLDITQTVFIHRQATTFDKFFVKLCVIVGEDHLLRTPSSNGQTFNGLTVDEETKQALMHDTVLSVILQPGTKLLVNPKEVTVKHMVPKKGHESYIFGSGFTATVRQRQELYLANLPASAVVIPDALKLQAQALLNTK